MKTDKTEPNDIDLLPFSVEKAKQYASEGTFFVEDPSGDIIEFILGVGWKSSCAENIAKEYAEDEYNCLSPDLSPPDEWPRTYRVFFDGEWIEVNVDLSYIPVFTT